MRNKGVAIFLVVVMITVMVMGVCGCDGGIPSAYDKASAAIGGQKEEGTEKPEAPGPTISPEEAEAIAREARIVKENAYITLSNMMGERFQDSLERYFKYLGSKEKVSQKQPYSPYSMGEYYTKMVQEALDYVEKEPEMPELDTLVEELAPVVLDTMALLDKIVSYYDLKNYVDDDFEKGQEYHTQLLALNEQLQEPWDVYNDAISKMVETNQNASLLELKEANCMIQYYAIESIMNAKKLMKYLQEGEITSDNIHKTKMEEFQPHYEALSKSVLAFLEMAEDSAAKENEQSFTGAVRFSLLKSELAELKTCATEMYDLIKSGKKARSDTGTPYALSEQLSAVVSEYNYTIE